MKLLIICLFFFTKQAHSAKILSAFLTPSPSHYFLGSALARGLAEKGHDVTMVSLYGEKDPPVNVSYRDIVLTDLLEDFNRLTEDLNMWQVGNLNMFLVLPFMLYVPMNLTEVILNHPKVQELLNSGETFDVVVLEKQVVEAHKGIAAHFNAPFIIFNPVGSDFFTNMLSGNPAPPSYVVDPIIGYSSEMTFFERTVNTLFQNYAQFVYYYFFLPQHKKIYDKYFPNAPDFYDAVYNASIYFLNSHPSMNQAKPYVPNMIDVGGLHIRPTKKLPQDLQKLLDESKDGVIYFSMGSFLKCTKMPAEKREVLIRTFAKLKQKVIWKWEEDVLPGQPKNVILGKWLPQQEILAHPNVKLFITHAGILSTTETIYHGVPVLALPVFGDQKLNAQKMVNEGIGLFIHFEDISEDILTQTLEDLLQNPKYAENAKRKSKIFHDRQVTPLDTAIYWVEYVIRHGGAPHLRVAGLDLPWYKYMLIDVVAFILLVTLIGFYVNFKIVKMAIGWCMKSKKQKLKKN